MLEFLATPLLLIERLEDRRLHAFGVTETAAAFVVDNGADLKFSVLKGGNLSSTIHLGDLTSVQYKGREMLAPYSATSRYSHYEQGLSATTKVSYQIDAAQGWIKITADDSASGTGGVIHYYVVRRGDNNLYMASLPNDVNGGPGEGRFIAYLAKPVFTNVEQPSNIAGNAGAVEGSDVFRFASGQTASKFYNDRRMIENSFHGVTGNNVGAWMFMGNRETSSGGAFFKDIDLQTTGGATELYNCLFTGHTQTEAFRQGLKGPYALQFNDGGKPATPDYSFLESVAIKGLVKAADRGAVSGKATGVPTGHEVTVGLSNPAAQYWATPAASGTYSVTGVLPGTYTETLYDNELAVSSRQVTVKAGATTRAEVVNTRVDPAAVWRIDTFDGTPLGFFNADKVETMHPSDVRMSSWTAVSNYVVGKNTAAQFPMAQFMDVNNSQRISFDLTAAQAATPLTLRIGITLGFEGGRNRVVVNAGQSSSWTSKVPAASRDLNSRGITRGTWRGENQLYTYDIPASALRAGTNTIGLPVVSGSYVAGQGFLSPSVVYDAIDLVPTASVTAAPRVAALRVVPPAGIVPGATKLFTAVATDQFGKSLAANVTWTAARGSIDDTGTYKAPATAGPDTVTATVGNVTVSKAFGVLASTTDLAVYKADVAGNTLADATGNNFAATLTGAFSSVPGVSGNAVKFAGGSATVPAGVVGTATDFTVAAWVKLDRLETWARVFDFGNSTQSYLFLTPQSPLGKPRFAITTSGGAGEQIVDSSVALKLNAWTHVAVTLSGNTATLYIDGVARGKNDAVTLRPADIGDTDNRIAASRFAADPKLLGSVDEFRVVARAYSASEIAKLAAPPVGPGATITGRLFGDTDRDGVWDSNEPLAANRRVWLDLDDDGVFDKTEPSVLSDARGVYTFTGLAARKYHVRRVFPAGYAESTPPRYVTVTTPGSVFGDVNIGSKVK